MKVLHVHQDYPDGMPYPYTLAVKNLIDSCVNETSDVEHFVLSINRTSNPFKAKVKKFESGLAIIYWGIPLPILYYFSLWLTSILLYRVLNQSNFDLVHGHKLTTEGGLSYFLAKKMNIPYILSVRGGSDVKNINRFKLHHSFFAKVYRGAAEIFWVSPWAKTAVELAVNETVNNVNLLPNICDIDIENASQIKTKSKRFVMAMAFNDYKRKGIIQVIKAISILKQRGIKIHLDVYGGGPNEKINIVQNEIDKSDVEDCIILKGKVSQKNLRQEMSNAKAFILPSVKETFGMSFIEALSVGCPIIYMSNTGIDGLFDSYKIGIKLDDQSPSSIAQSFLDMNQDYSNYCKGVSAMNSNGYLQEFTGKKVSKMYLDILKRQISV